MDQILALVYRAVARKKLQPRRTHGPLYEISRMKSSNIISLIKKNKNRQYLIKFYRGECLGSPHTGYGGGILDFKAQDPDSTSRNFPDSGFYKPDFLTWGDYQGV